MLGYNYCHRIVYVSIFKCCVRKNHLFDANNVECFVTVTVEVLADVCECLICDFLCRKHSPPSGSYAGKER